MKFIRAYQLFESVDDIEEIVSNIKDMLLELSDLEYSTKVFKRRETIRPVGSSGPFASMNYKDSIAVIISKPARVTDAGGHVYANNSFSKLCVRPYTYTIEEYLKSEGFHLISDNILTRADGYSGERSNRGWITRLEMIFEKK